MKDEARIDHSSINIWFKKFHSGYKTLTAQAEPGWFKSMNSKS